MNRRMARRKRGDDWCAHTAQEATRAVALAPRLPEQLYNMVIPDMPHPTYSSHFVHRLKEDLCYRLVGDALRMVDKWWT